MNAARLIATFFGAGLLRPAPGTWGTVAALPAAWVIATLGGFPVFALATVAVFFIGWWVTAIATRGMSDPDPSEIVIDEVAGMWITLLPVVYGAWSRDLSMLALWPGWLVGFVAFRAFDITKIGPIGWADRLHTPLGVMLDDALAGVAAAVVVIIAAVVAHGFIMA